MRVNLLLLLAAAMAAAPVSAQSGPNAQAAQRPLGPNAQAAQRPAGPNAAIARTSKLLREPYFASCAAAGAVRATPVRKGESGYGRHLDRDGDGVACD